MRELVPSFGDNVRIRATPLTERRGLAGLTGSVAGETTPSVTGVDVVGEVTQDFALNVLFDDPAQEQLWFAPELVEFIDHAAGTLMSVGDVQMVRRADGGWDTVRSPYSSRRRTVCAITVGILSVLLLMAALFALGQLRPQLNRIPKLPAEPLFFARLGLADAALVVAACVSSLAYLFNSRREIWKTAWVLLLLSIMLHCLLALLFWISLKRGQQNAPRNDFSGIANWAAFMIGVFIPGVVAATTVIVLLCLNYLRPLFGHRFGAANEEHVSAKQS